MSGSATFTATTSDTLLNTAPPSGVGNDNFILQITGFNQNGVPVSVPGLGTSFGLYIEGSVTVQGSPSVYGPGTISLVLDPTNNDGTASASWDPATQTGSIGFSNLANTSDDIVLATGSFTGGSFGTQSNGQPGTNFTQTFNLNPGIFGPNAGANLGIEETLFNTATSRIAGTTANGGSYITSNGGYGIVDLTKASVTGNSSPSFYSGNNANNLIAELGTLASLGGSGSPDIRAIAKEVLADLGVNLPASFLPCGGSGPTDIKHRHSGGGFWQNFDAGADRSPRVLTHGSH